MIEFFSDFYHTATFVLAWALYSQGISQLRKEAPEISPWIQGAGCVVVIGLALLCAWGISEFAGWIG